MGRAHATAHRSFPPDQFVAALTDFGPGRSEIWGNSSPKHLALHDRGATWAEVTEGSDAGGGVWQRLRYNWSAPGVVTLDVLDSNASGAGSRCTYRLGPDGSGGTLIDRSAEAPATVEAAEALGAGDPRLRNRGGIIRAADGG